MAQLVKNPPAMRETWVRKIPWRRERLPTPDGVAKSWTQLNDFHFHSTFTLSISLIIKAFKVIIS